MVYHIFVVFNLQTNDLDRKLERNLDLPIN